MGSEVRGLHTPATYQELPFGWSWRRLDAVCDGVFDCPHSTPRLTTDGPYIARSQDIRSGVFRMHEAGHISETTYRDRIARAEPQHGDLLYSREGTYFGIAAEVPPDVRVCLGQRMVLLRPNPSAIDFRFLRYWLNSSVMALHIHGHRDGSVAERLNLPTIRGLPVAIPPLPEQRAIAYILSTLEDRIELNRQMNETLDPIARALFHSWFVDFDPVRAKAERRDPALPKQIADLFPASFQVPELGGIPTGWRAGHMADLMEISRNGISPCDFPDETFDHFSIPAFDEERRPKAENGASIKSNKFVLPLGAVLLSKLNPRIPRIWLPDLDPSRRAICSTEFLVVLPKADTTREFLFCLFGSAEFAPAFGALVTGTSGSHQRVRPEGLAGMRIIVPERRVIQEFTRLVKPLFERRGLAVSEYRTLSTLRDTLLHQLISGELRVMDAERFVSGAA